MDFEVCSLENTDYVFKQNHCDTFYVGVVEVNESDQYAILTNAYWKYLFIGDSEQDIIDDMGKYSIPIVPQTYTKIPLVQIMRTWRSVVYRGHRLLVLGCNDDMASTLLAFPSGPVYPSVHQGVLYVRMVPGDDSSIFLHQGHPLVAGSYDDLVAQIIQISQDIALGIYNGTHEVVGSDLYRFWKRHKTAIYFDNVLDLVISIKNSAAYREMQIQKEKEKNV
jgi:hypothetical protein